MAGLIQGVIGLNTLTHPHALSIELPHVSGVHAHSSVAHAATASSGPQPCSAASSAAPGQDAYTANEIAGRTSSTASTAPVTRERESTVALFELEPNSSSDIAAYQSCYGTSATVNYIKVDGGAGTGAGQGEAALDIEDVIGLAPKATVDVYQAPNTNTGVIDNYTAIVDNDTEQVISTSWGECESQSGSGIISEEGHAVPAGGHAGADDLRRRRRRRLDRLRDQRPGGGRSGQPAVCDRRGRPDYVDDGPPADGVGVERLQHEHRRGRRRHLELVARCRPTSRARHRR